MKKQIVSLLKILFTVFVFIYIFNKFDVDFKKLFTNINWLILSSTVILRLIIMPVIYINRWKLFLTHSGINEKFFTLLKISFISSFMGIVLPSSQGGDVVRMIMIEKKHKGFTQNKTASSSIIIERMLGFALLALVGLIFSFIVPNFPQKSQVIILISIITLLLFIIIFLLVNKKSYTLLSRLLIKLPYLKKITGFVEKTHYSLVTFPYRKVLVSSTILILLLQLFSILIVYLVFLSFGVTLPFTQHLAFYPIIAILSVIPISISGLGIREGFFVFFYSLVGVAPDVAIGVSLINYTVEVLLAAFLGGILYALKSINIIKI